MYLYHRNFILLQETQTLLIHDENLILDKHLYVIQRKWKIIKNSKSSNLYTLKPKKKKKIRTHPTHPIVLKSYDSFK
jgi:hypothetical protein